MSHEISPLDVLDLMSLASGFYDALDDRDYERVLSCFAPDGIWWRRGKAVEGLPEIRRALNSRPADFHTCHIVSNLQIFPGGRDEARARFYMTGHPFHGDMENGKHQPLPEAHIVALYEDSMRRIAGRWKIVEKRLIKTLFKNNAVLP